MGRALRFAGVSMLLGAVLGIAIASWTAPRFFGWYSTPGQGPGFCDCARIAQSTAEGVIHAQLIGGAIGAGLFALFGFLIGWRRRTSPAPASPAGSAP